MKVNCSEVDKIYNSMKEEKISGMENEPGAVKETGVNAKRDSLVISEKAKSHSGVGGVVNRVVNDVDKPACSEKLLRLKKEIAGGTYSVSGQDIAEKILGHKDAGKEK